MRRFATLLALVASLSIAACKSDGGGGGITPPPPPDDTTPHMQVVSGTGQGDSIGSTLPQPFVFQAQNSLGKPLAGILVKFNAGKFGDPSPASATTDANGNVSTRVKLYWTLMDTTTKPGVTAYAFDATGNVRGTGAGIPFTVLPGQLQNQQCRGLDIGSYGQTSAQYQKTAYLRSCLFDVRGNAIPQTFKVLPPFSTVTDSTTWIMYPGVPKRYPGIVGWKAPGDSALIEIYDSATQTLRVKAVLRFTVYSPIWAQLLATPVYDYLDHGWNCRDCPSPNPYKP